MPSQVSTPEAYLESLPPDRQAMVSAIRDAVNRGLRPGFEEGIQYGMIGWYVPHSLYPPGYHCDPRQPVPFVGVASKAAGVSLHLFCVYLDPALHAAFAEGHAAAGKRLDMGKGCARYKKLQDVPLDLLTDVVARVSVEGFLATYTAQIPPSAKKKARGAG